MKYFRLRDDIDFLERWYLGDVRHVNNWLYRNPPVDFMEPGKSQVELYRDGNEMDFTLTERYAVPIISEEFLAALSGLDEIDEPHTNVVFNPVEIVGKNTKKKYYAMVIETQLDCVDEANSDFQKYEENDLVRPDLAGEYRVFIKLIIDSDAANRMHVFRIQKYLGAIVVSEEVKRRLVEAGVSGVIFEDVNR